MTFEIRTLADDEQITEPGFYQISLDRHHNQPCDGPSVTSGVLRRMELHSPAEVWAFHKLNPDRWEQEDKTALRLGRAMAAYVEGGMDEVSKHFCVLPTDKPNRPTGAQIKNYALGNASDAAKRSVEFWMAVEDDYRDVLTAAEDKMIRDMGRVLAKDPAASAVMSGLPEITMAWRDEQTGLWLLARPDTVSFDGSSSDYKKMNTMGKPFDFRLVDRRITEHAYDCQMSFAAYVFERLTGEYPTSVGIVAQVDKAPHHVILREISEEDLRIAEWRNRVQINRFHECLTSGYWPGPGDDVGAYQRPEWQYKMLIEQMNTAGEAP